MKQKEDDENDEKKAEAAVEESSGSELPYQINWRCEYCSKEFSFSFKDQMIHQIKCDIESNLEMLFYHRCFN